MREIVLDTETTGLDPAAGHRIVEVGCVELVNHLATGVTFHAYFNPERDMPPEAEAVHGLSSAFLAGKPLFGAIAPELAAFLDTAPLIIHNAAFDMGFLNAEFKRAGLAVLPNERAIDTLMLSRRKNPAGPHSLDQLCQRFGIDNSRRKKHGALLDAELLAEVYLELIGGRQTALVLAEDRVQAGAGAVQRAAYGPRPTPLPSRLSEGELAAHAAFVGTLGEAALWKRYGEATKRAA